MGLLQKAVETYDSHIAYAGENCVGMVMMAPVGHIVTRADLEITIDRDGRFESVSAVDREEPKIVIPATESSAGRTSAPCAHPLCDQIGYLIPENETKYRLYLEQLTNWANSDFSHPKLAPILDYVRGGTLLGDLISFGAIRLNDAGRPENEKLLIRWRVLGETPEECWLDQSLFDAFTQWYLLQNADDPALCMVTGKKTAPAGQHPKGIIPINGNAKLISANDSSGFTYRGRFSEEWHAATVGREASQKAHNALRWLTQEQGVFFGGRTFLCWNPQGRSVKSPTMPFISTTKPIFRPTEYRDALKKVLEGLNAELKPADGVVLVAFDAATTGRLAVTYYNELLGTEFLQRLHDWDAVCCWPDRRFGIQSPPMWQIVNCAFGTQQTEKGVTRLKTDDRIMRQMMQRLISSRVDRGAIGADIVKALVSRASRLLAYEENVRENLLFTACAVIRKYRYDRFKEEYIMALEPEKNDRSYQFGRLLAVLEKVERDTYNGEEREPNAIRMQSVFCQRPMYAANHLEKQLERAYFPRLHPAGRIRYKNLIGQIMMAISQFPQEEWNRPLDDSYLMGYYLQRSALYTKNTNDAEE